MGGTGAVTLSSSAAMGTGTAPMVGTSSTAPRVRRTSSPVPETEPVTLDRTAAITRTAAPMVLMRRTVSSANQETFTARYNAQSQQTCSKISFT